MKLIDKILDWKTSSYSIFSVELTAKLFETIVIYNIYFLRTLLSPSTTTLFRPRKIPQAGSNLNVMLLGFHYHKHYMFITILSKKLNLKYISKLIPRVYLCDIYHTYSIPMYYLKTDHNNWQTKIINHVIISHDLHWTICINFLLPQLPTVKC